MFSPVPTFTVPGYVPALGACLLAVLFTAAILRRRRYPAAVVVFVIVMVFTLVLLTAHVDQVAVATLIATAGAVAVRLSHLRGREI